MSGLDFTAFTINDANPPKPKGKPRGKPFVRGADPRRQGYAPRNIGDACPACEAKNASAVNGLLPDGTPAYTVGKLAQKHGRNGAFVGCDQYPLCTYTQNAEAGTSDAATPSMTFAAGSLEAKIFEIARQAAEGAVNESRVVEIVGNALNDHADAISANVAEIVTQAVAQIGLARPVSVQINDLPAVTLETSHAVLPEALGRMKAGLNVALVGPAGCGKTHMGAQIAQCLGVEFAGQSCAPGLPESTFTGRMVPNLTTGDEHFRGTTFTRMFEHGGLFMFDECDNLDPSTALVVNSALANGHLTLPGDAGVLTKSPNFYAIACMNTYGHGQSREYVGRAQLDAAFLDRFVGATLPVDYDPTLEAKLCPETEIRNAVLAIRQKTRDLKLRRVVSTRALIAARKLVVQLGKSVPDAMRAITEGWTIEDRKACGVAV